MGVLNVGPTTPTESNSGVPTGGFSQWFRNIGDWIKSMSPNGATDYDTGWVAVPLASGFQSIGGVPAVRRVGREIKWQGQVQPNPAGAFPTGAVVTVVPSGGLPSAFRPVGIINRMVSGPSANQAARAYVSSNGEVVIVTGPTTGIYYDLSALSGYMVD